MKTYTAEQAYTNWHYCFTSGYLTAARAWWNLYSKLTFGTEGS